MASYTTEYINNQPLFWENRTFADPIIPELRRRNNATNIGQNTNNFDIFSYKQTFQSYKGHMVPWIRVFSNGTGIQKNSRVPVSDFLKKRGEIVEYDGFILSGGKNFLDSYGFSSGTGGQIESPGYFQAGRTILGYQANGNPHYIDPVYQGTYKNYYAYSSNTGNDYPQNNSVPVVLPAPGIESFNVRLMKDHKLTETKFKFKCYSIAQLEYMMPFFLTPGITIFAEFGWNVFSYDSLLNEDDLVANKLYDLMQHPWKVSERIYDSRGNYGLTIGMITDYNFSTSDNYTYECNVTAMSPQNFYESNRIDRELTSRSDNSDGSKYIMSFKGFLRQKIPHLYSITNGIGTDGPTNFIEFFQKYLPLSKEDVISKRVQVKTEDRGVIGTNFGGSRIRTDVSSVIETNTGDLSVIETDTGNYAINNTNDTKKKNEFYNGKIEDRVFTTRNKTGTLILKIDIDVDWEKFSRSDDDSLARYKSPIYLDSDTNIDFDANGGKDGNESKLWLTLGLLVDIINYKNKAFNIHVDIDDVVINAHPNLISCDPDILIPNPVAPKINHGRVKPSGFLDDLDQDNKFSYQLFKQKRIDELDSAFEAVYRIFKTVSRTNRQDLDSLINYNRKDNNEGQHGIPFKNVPKSLEGKNYTAYRYGYLKNIYISDNFILELANNNQISTFKQFMSAVLTKINKSVNNYWEFEFIVDDISKRDMRYTIIDKSLNNIKKIYQFELGGDNNVIKSINFDVKLSNEQANQVLNSAGNSLSTDAEYDMYTSQKSLPNLSYIDRFDALRNEERTTELKKIQDIENKDDEVQQFQTYGNVSKFSIKNNFLMVTGKSYKNDKIYYHLNFPSQFLSKLSQILDDKDYKNNVAQYSNIADNFIITITLDGNYGFKPLNVFSISNLPKPYVAGNCLFQIMEVNHVINNGKWETEITAMLKGDTPSKTVEFEKI